MRRAASEKVYPPSMGSGLPKAVKKASEVQRFRVHSFRVESLDNSRNRSNVVWKAIESRP
jgi:hypothetical protein